MGKSKSATVQQWESDVMDDDDVETAGDAPSKQPEDPTDPPSAESDLADPDEKASPATTDDDAGDDPDALAATPAGTTDQPAPGDQPNVEPRPFSFRAYGKDVQIPGAFTHGKHVVMTLDAFNRHMLPRIADPEQLQAREKEYRTRIRDLEAQASGDNNEAVLRASFILEHLDKAFENEESAEAFLGNLETNMRLLHSEAENHVHSKRGEFQTSRTQAESDEATVASTRASFEGGLKTGIQNVLGEEAIKGLGLDADDLYRRLRPLWTQWARYAEEGDGSGLAVGTPYVSLEFIRSYLEPTVTLVTKERNNTAVVAEAEKKNAEALASGKKAPPAVTSRNTPSPGGKQKEIKTAEDWRSSVMEDDD